MREQQEEKQRKKLTEHAKQMIRKELDKLTALNKKRGALKKKNVAKDL